MAENHDPAEGTEHVEQTDHGCGRTGAGCGGCREDTVVVARRVPASMSAVALQLPLLERPAAITENRVARITQIGRYEMPSVPGSALRIQPGRINLRIDADAVTGVFLAESGTPEQRLPALRLHDREGLSHRCHPLLDTDRLVLETLAEPDPDAADGFPMLPRVAADPIYGDDQLGRIDALLTSRMAPYVPHRHIDRDVLFAMLEHACAVGLPLGVGVLSGSAMHVVQGTVHGITHAEDRAVLASADATIELILRRVRHALHVRTHGAHGPTSMIELYDDRSRRVVLVTQFGIVGEGVHEAWEDLAASLPDATD